MIKLWQYIRHTSCLAGYHTRVHPYNIIKVILKVVYMLRDEKPTNSYHFLFNTLFWKQEIKKLFNFKHTSRTTRTCRWLQMYRNNEKTFLSFPFSFEMLILTRLLHSNFHCCDTKKFVRHQHAPNIERDCLSFP